MKEISYRPNGSKRVRTINSKPSLTDQQYKDDCDVNTIIERGKKTGQVNHIAKIQGQFADVSEISDLHSSMIKMQHATEAFNKLPLKIKRRFDYDMKQLLSFLDNPQNRNEAIELGIIPKLPIVDDGSKSPKDPKPSEPKKPIKPQGDNHE